MRGMNMLALYPKSDRGIDPDTCIGFPKFIFPTHVSKKTCASKSPDYPLKSFRYSKSSIRNYAISVQEFTLPTEYSVMGRIPFTLCSSFQHPLCCHIRFSPLVLSPMVGNTKDNTGRSGVVYGKCPSHVARSGHGID